MNSQTRHPLRIGARLLAAAWILVAVTASTLSAQQTGAGETAPPAAEKPTGPQPIPASQISLKAQETESVLKSMRDRPTPDPHIVKIGEDVATALGQLHDLEGATDEALKKGISVRELEDLNRRWARENERIDEWVTIVQRRAESLDRDLGILQKGRATWDITLSSAKESGVQEALIEIIQNETASIAVLEKQFGDRRAEILTIQGQLAEADGIVDAALTAIENAKNDTSRFFSTESPPLWSLLANLPPKAHHAEQLRTVWKEAREDLREFALLYESQLIRHLLLFLAILAILILLNRKARDLDPDTPEVEAAKHILGRPLAAALVLSLALVSPRFPDAPRIVDDVTIIGLIPVLFRLRPPGTASALRAPLIVLFTLIVITRFNDMLVYLSALQRVILCVVSVSATVFLAVAIHKRALRAVNSHTAMTRVISVAAVIAMLLLGIAAVTNLIGFYAIASILTTGVLASGYIGAILYIIRFIIVSAVWIGLGTPLAQRLRTVSRHEQLIRKRILSLTRVVLGFMWFYWTLHILQIGTVVFDGLRGFLTAEAKFGQISISLWGVISLVLTIWGAFLLSRFIRFVLEDDVYPRLWLPRGVPNAISTSIHYVILTIGFFLALAATGADLSKFALLAGAFGVGLGFGLQNVVANFVSGLILIFERPIMQGDTVEVGTVSGIVKRIGMRSTTVRTWEGAEVIVPNGKLIAEEVTNWTLSDRRRRIDIEVGVAYGTDTTKVLELLAQVAADHPDTLDDPPPRALFAGFGDSSLDFQLRAWTLKIESRLTIKSELAVTVEKAIKEAGIEIPFPQRDLHVRSVDSEAGRALADKSPPNPPQTSDD